MAKLNHSATLSVGGKIHDSWGNTVGAIRKGSESLKKQIAKVKDEQRGVALSLAESERAASKFGIEGSAALQKLNAQQKKLQGTRAAAESELKKAQRAALKGDQKAAKVVDDMIDKIEELEHAEKRLGDRIETARKYAVRMAVDGSEAVRKLRMEHEKLDKTLEREQRRLRNSKAWESLNIGGRMKSAIGGTLKNLGDGFVYLGKKALFAGTAIGGALAGGAAWFTKSAVDATAKIETMETALETLMGSPEKARQSMDWITKFAADTPFELDEVGEAFTRLKAYGIDPTRGSLRILGDTGASMGKTVMAGVEALADALTGSNERLKEFGIRAVTHGNKITYYYKDKLGRDVKESVNKLNQGAIGDTLLGIWESKFDGAMKRQSRTWKGMVSSLSDQWMLFQVRIMRSGVFDTLKNGLSDTLDQVNRWADDGTLQRWADEIARAYRWSFDRVKEGFHYVRENWPEIKKNFGEFYESAKKVGTWLWNTGVWIKDAVGGGENLAKGLALLGAAKVLSPLGGLVKVGWDIVAWLAKASGLSGVVARNLGLITTPAKQAVKTAARSTGGWLGRGAAAAWGGLAAGAGKLWALGQTGVAAAGTGAVAGTVALGGALGYGAGTLINKGTEWATGRTLSDHIAYGLSGDIDRRRAELAGGPARTTRGFIPTPQMTSIHSPTDARQFTFNVQSNAADPAEVARQVMFQLNDQMSRRSQAAYAP